ncbi:11283_t:CDS:2, partial [Entrophospora sp. SA101]
MDRNSSRNECCNTETCHHSMDNGEAINNYNLRTKKIKADPTPNIKKNRSAHTKFGIFMFRSISQVMFSNGVEADGLTDEQFK